MGSTFWRPKFCKQPTMMFYIFLKDWDNRHLFRQGFARWEPESLGIKREKPGKACAHAEYIKPCFKHNRRQHTPRPWIIIVCAHACVLDVNKVDVCVVFWVQDRYVSSQNIAGLISQLSTKLIILVNELKKNRLKSKRVKLISLCYVNVLCASTLPVSKAL